MVMSLRRRPGASSKVSTTEPFGSTTSTRADLMPPRTPAATREPERSTVNGWPALTGSGETVMLQIGGQGFTSTVAVLLTPPETALTS